MEAWDELQGIIQEFLKLLGLRLSAFSIRGESHRLQHFFRHLLLSKKDYRAITKQDVESYLLMQNWRQHTRVTALSSIKRFYDHLRQKQIVICNPAQDITVHAQKELPLIQVPPLCKIKEILRKMEKDKTPVGLRNRLMVELAYGSGMRRNEIATLNIEDVEITGQTAHVLGKGRKERVVPLSRRCVAALAEYIGRIKEPRKFLFATKQNTRLGVAAVGAVIKQKTGVNAHLFRHACATHMLLAGCSIRYIQELLGHERTNTTQIYTRLNKDELRKVVNEKHPCRKRSSPIEP